LLVFVEKIELGAWVNIHMAATSAWRYVGGVVEFALATPKQKRRNVAKQKHNRTQTPTCGVP